MVYLYVAQNIAWDVLGTPVPGDLGFYLFGLLAFPIYIISIIINVVKMIKYRAQTERDSDDLKARIAFWVIIIIPIVCVAWGSVRDYYRIKHCDAVVIIFSRRDTKRLLDNDSFGYVIRGDKVHGFDLMLNDHIRWFADEGLLAGERNDTKTEMGEYEVRIQSDDVYIYHNDNQIFIYDSTPAGFYTNEISECYYRE
ncbi:MAG: hypothetical protein J5696_01605 [Lachnospiraceae bacterium]|nr:hypothetical protein [Lachnospiraceae bacterium]